MALHSIKFGDWRSGWNRILRRNARFDPIYLHFVEFSIQYITSTLVQSFQRSPCSGQLPCHWPNTVIRPSGHEDSNAGHHGIPLGRIYCLSILRSFPEMLCASNGSLPPFIHPQCQASACLETDPKYVEMLPEPLTVCSSIMRMYLARSPRNLAVLWRTIQPKAARIEVEVGDPMSISLLETSLKDTVSVLRCPDHAWVYPSHGHVSHPGPPSR